MQDLQSARAWRSLANALTALRFVAAPLCAIALYTNRAQLALGLFVLAVLSDLLDGWSARRGQQPSARGALFDHGTDAWFVSLGLSALAARDVVPVALPALVLLAFTQYALDSGALSGRQLRASWLGRFNGIAYWVLLGTVVVRDGLSLGWPGASLLTIVAWLLLASTLMSIGDRALASLRTRGREDDHG